MSYLDWPRINLGGTFFTDPSTINNDPSHYDASVTRPSPWQNPKGLHRFKFTDVKVRAALDQNGAFVEHDPIIGATANSVDQPSAAKIVDLDVYQQGVSTIFGFTLQISFTNNLAQTINIVGAMDPCPCNGLWFQRVLPTRGWQSWDGYGNASFGGDTYASASFQSVLRIKPATWPAATQSVIDQLRSATTTDTNGNLLLSIRMVLDSYNNVPWHDDFNLGRAVVTLGPVLPGELAHIPGARWLNPRAINTGSDPWYWPNLFNAPFKFVQRSSAVQTLVIDLADAICMQEVGGPPVPLGTLTAALGSTANPVGSFQITQDLYENLGGIIELPVSAALWQQQTQPLGIVTDPANDVGGPTLWQEVPDGLVIDANDQVFRLQAAPPGPTATAKVRVTQWGAPLVGYQPNIVVVPVVPTNQGASVPWSGGYTGDTPSANGALQATVSTTDQNGDCTVTLTVVNDPGSRTSQLDSQLYFVLPYSTAQPPDMNKVPPRQESLISVIVYTGYTETPTWETVKTIMTPYVKLYPGMTDQIDLTQQQAFFTFAVNPPWIVYDGPHFKPYTLPDGRTIAAGAIPYYMTRPFTDTRFMPVTRDLSPDKLLHVLTYIADLQAVVKPTPPPPSEGKSDGKSGGKP